MMMLGGEEKRTRERRKN